MKGMSKYISEMVDGEIAYMYPTQMWRGAQGGMMDDYPIDLGRFFYGELRNGETAELGEIEITYREDGRVFTNMSDREFDALVLEVEQNPGKVLTENEAWALVRQFPFISPGVMRAMETGDDDAINAALWTWFDRLDGTPIENGNHLGLQIERDADGNYKQWREYITFTLG